VCQLEGSDHGGRDSAAELALAGTISVQTPDGFSKWADFGASRPPDVKNYTPREYSVNDFVSALVIQLCRKLISIDLFDQITQRTTRI